MPDPNGSPSSFTLLTESLSRFETIHLRHVDIDQGSVEGRQPRSRQSHLPTRHTDDSVTGSGQHRAKSIEDGTLIIHDKHPLLLHVLPRLRNVFHPVNQTYLAPRQASHLNACWWRWTPTGHAN